MLIKSVKSKLKNLVLETSHRLRVSHWVNPRHKTIAICYYGPVRSFRELVDTHEARIIRPLITAGFKVRIYVHAWALNAKQHIWETEIDIPEDLAAWHLIPSVYCFHCEPQDEYLKGFPLEDYFNPELYDDLGDMRYFGEWRSGLVQNYVCSLESQRRVFEMISDAADLVIYIRPDVKFDRPIDVSILKRIRTGEIWIPNFDHFEGVNDRFSIMTYGVASVYSKRIFFLRRYRKIVGRISSERYTRDFISGSNIKIKKMDLTFEIVRPS